MVSFQERESSAIRLRYDDHWKEFAHSKSKRTHLLRIRTGGREGACGCKCEKSCRLTMSPEDDKAHLALLLLLPLANLTQTAQVRAQVHQHNYVHTCQPTLKARSAQESCSGRCCIHTAAAVSKTPSQPNPAFLPTQPLESPSLSLSLSLCPFRLVLTHPTLQFQYCPRGGN